MRHLAALVERSAERWLRPGGALLLEVGGDQAAHVAGRMRDSQFEVIDVLGDEDGDERGIVGRLPQS